MIEKFLMSCIKSRRGAGKRLDRAHAAPRDYSPKGGLSAGLRLARTQHAHQFPRVEAVLADLGAIQQQDGDVEAVAPGQQDIGIHVPHFDRGKLYRRAKLRELEQHLLAKLAAIAAQQGQLRPGQGRDIRSSAAVGSGSGRKASAIALTVWGGTSPTAVTR